MDGGGQNSKHGQMSLPGRFLTFSSTGLFTGVTKTLRSYKNSIEACDWTVGAEGPTGNYRQEGKKRIKQQMYVSRVQNNGGKTNFRQNEYKTKNIQECFKFLKMIKFTINFNNLNRNPLIN